MRLIVNFPKPFAALEEALEVESCSLARNIWNPGDARSVGAEACLLDFCSSARRLRDLWRLARVLRPLGVPLVAIDRDAPWYKGVRRRRLWALSLIRPLDIYASHSLQGAARFANTTLYLANAARLPAYGLHGRTLDSLRDAGSYRYDVSFIGNLDAARYPEHARRVTALRDLQTVLAAEGVILELFDAARMSVEEQVAVIQQSRINLNLGAAADDGAERSWGLPERCYGIPAAGGFLLSDSRRHAANDFEPGREWVEYAGSADCPARIRYYLAHFEESRAIAEEAHHRVLMEHTYAHRAKRLLRTIRDWQASYPMATHDAAARQDAH